MKHRDTRLKKFMRVKQIKQIDLSIAANIDAGTISKYVNGIVMPSDKTYEILADALNCSAEQIKEVKKERVSKPKKDNLVEENTEQVVPENTVPVVTEKDTVTELKILNEQYKEFLEEKSQIIKKMDTIVELLTALVRSGLSVQPDISKGEKTPENVAEETTQEHEDTFEEFNARVIALAKRAAKHLHLTDEKKALNKAYSIMIGKYGIVWKQESLEYKEKYQRCSSTTIMLCYEKPMLRSLLTSILENMLEKKTGVPDMDTTPEYVNYVLGCVAKQLNDYSPDNESSKETIKYQMALHENADYHAAEQKYAKNNEVTGDTFATVISGDKALFKKFCSTAERLGATLSVEL